MAFAVGPFDSKTSGEVAFRVAKDKKDYWVTCELPTALQQMKTNSAMNIKACIEAQTEFPVFDALRRRFKRVFDISIADRGSGGLLMDSMLSAQRPAARLWGLGCVIHNLHIIQSKAYGCLSETISGVIALALATQPAGAVSALRKSIAKVLARRAVVHVGVDPPDPGSQQMIRRQMVFDELLGCSDGLTTFAAKRRRLVLESSLQGDLESNVVDLYLFDVTAENIPRAVATWAIGTAKALVPSCLKVGRGERDT